MNRAERRKYLRKMERDEMATYCRICKHKTLHVSLPTYNHMCDIVCELCGTTEARDVDGCIPYTYVRLNEEQDGSR